MTRTPSKIDGGGVPTGRRVRLQAHPPSVVGGPSMDDASSVSLYAGAAPTALRTLQRRPAHSPQRGNRPQASVPLSPGLSYSGGWNQLAGSIGERQESLRRGIHRSWCSANGSGRRCHFRAANPRARSSTRPRQHCKNASPGPKADFRSTGKPDGPTRRPHYPSRKL